MTDLAPRRSFAVRGAALALAAALPCGVAPVVDAQVVMPVANPDADRLADLVRRLGAAPRDLSALIEAGDLSFTLGDATAAAALYKRAEAIDPNNGRVKAGIARILVNGERPGEALRYFEQAERYGAPMARYADDRGLAYDLIGQQERAQRDYRTALSQGGRDADAVDEVRRRYALSLGISGRQEEALAQIDTLLRRSDRGAWRARAFILAMSGDVAGANKIATSMMPPGMAGGLAAFFQRLPSLGATDRAFAVHFGEVAPTPARLADARFVPALPALPDTRPVQVAAAAPVATAPVAEKKLSRSEQRRRDREAARATQVAAAAARRTPPVVASTATVQPVPGAATRTAPGVATGTAPVRTPPATAAPVAVARATPVPPVATSAGTAPAVAVPTQVAAARTAAPTATGVGSASTTEPTQVAATRTAPPVATSATVAPAGAAPTQVAAARTTVPVPQPRAVVAAPARAVPPRLSEDSILARIVAGISVPGAELGVAPMPGSQRIPVIAAPPAPAPVATASLDDAARAAERNVAADEQKRQRLAAAKRVTVAAPVVTEEEPKRSRTSARGKEAAEATAKPPVERKLTAREKAAATARKEAAAKEAAEKKAARAEPERIWVQVAGGANADDLPKAWKGAQTRAEALKGRRGYVTPNRATHRVVTGPFKTEAEARAMVNTLRKQGVQAFQFTSDAGQKMTRLDGR